MEDLDEVMDPLVQIKSGDIASDAESIMRGSPASEKLIDTAGIGAKPQR